MTTKAIAPHPQVREVLTRQWQAILNLLADFLDVPTALIMHLEHDSLTVYAKNSSIQNPYHIGDSNKQTAAGIYSELVIENDARLFEANSATQGRTDSVNYLGYPLHWPNGDLFGTICVLDTKPHYYSDKQEKLMCQLSAMIEASLELLEKNLELENLSGHLQQLANTDELTGILNRRAFIADADKEIKRAHRHDQPLSLLMMDLDDFKLINDSFGHETGDKVLKLFTDCVEFSKRSYDIFGRIGGEEFVILLPQTAHEAACELAERIRDEVASLSLTIKGQTIRITVSIGVTQMMPQENSVLTMLSRADSMLYSAKRSGKNQVLSALP